ncbi:peptidase S8/S53 domain-containing protein [Hypoxylon crocopeplum]|nr:peptidase S8/S53 domain-containing protein [Hypoxylon crocopeplum]
MAAPHASTVTMAGDDQGTQGAQGSALGDDDIFLSKENGNDEKTTLMTERLATYADPSTFYVSKTESVGINFWLASMSFAKADLFNVEFASEVASMYPQKAGVTSLYNPTYQTNDPSTGVSYQAMIKPPDDIPYHLIFVCQQKGRPIDDYRGRYFFDDADPIPGRDVPVYLVDTGATLDNPEFYLIRDKVEWLHAGKDMDGGNAEDDSAIDPRQINTLVTGHGTSMLSLVTGAHCGVSKGVMPILVRVPRRGFAGDGSSRGGDSTNEDYIEAISRVNDHLTEKTTEAKAIVLLAQHHERGNFVRNEKGLLATKDDAERKDFSAGFSTRMRFLLTDLASKGALIVTGTGNDKDNTDMIDGFPANFGRVDENPIPELLAVGAVNSTSFVRHFQVDYAHGLPHIFAPGQGVKAAEGSPNNWVLPENTHYKTSHGTSCAAAITAGLAAYFLRLVQIGHLRIDNSVLGLKNHILSDTVAWSRGPGPIGEELPAICNGLVIKSNPEPWIPPNPAPGPGPQ